MPKRFEEIEAQKNGRTSPPCGGRGGQGTFFRGHRGARDVEKVDPENYVKQIDCDVCSYLRLHTGTRLILAGVDSLTAMYHVNSHCDAIVKQTLSGNVDHLSAEELQARIEAVAGDERHGQYHLLVALHTSTLKEYMT